MPNRPGTPVWYELITDDPDAAQAFYGRIMGWSFEKASVGLERDYRTFSTLDHEGVGGIMKKPDEAAFAPSWFVYFGVDDVDASTDTLRSLGGSVQIEPTDIPNVGRFSFVVDPQGASFYLMRGDGERDSTAFAPMKEGHCSWNELVAIDQKAALAFYSALFGWTVSGTMPMGEMGDYTFIQSGDLTLGAMMDASDHGTTSFWNFAFTVADIDASRQAIEDGGGTVRHGPVELPDHSGWLIQGNDLHGAKVMFTGPRKD